MSQLSEDFWRDHKTGPDYRKVPFIRVQIIRSKMAWENRVFDGTEENGPN